MPGQCWRDTGRELACDKSGWRTTPGPSPYEFVPITSVTKVSDSILLPHTYMHNSYLQASIQISKMKGSQHGKYLPEIIPQNSDVIYSPRQPGLQ